MNVEETGMLLAAAAAFDSRDVGDSDILAWHRLLHGYRFADAQVALERHYSSSRDWLMPFDVIDGIKTLRAERLRDHIRLYGSFVASDGLSPEDELEERRKWHESVADGLAGQKAVEGPR